MKDKILIELNKQYLYKQFKYYGINGLCDWTGTIEEVGYVTQYITGEFPKISEWVKSNNSIVYSLDEILIIN